MLLVNRYAAVKVNPVVQKIIENAYNRFPRPINKDPKNPDRVIGTLLGYYEPHCVQVTKCFPIPYEESDDLVTVDESYNEEMIAAIKKSFPAEHPIGWFTTIEDISENTVQFQEYFYGVTTREWNSEKVLNVLLTMDPSFIGKVAEEFNTPFRAFFSSFAGIIGHPEPHCVIFNPICVELATFSGTKTNLTVEDVCDFDLKEEPNFLTNLEVLQNNTAEMITHLKKMQTYVNKVIANEKFDDEAETGQQLSNLVNSMSALFPSNTCTHESSTDWLEEIVSLMETQMDFTQKVIKKGK